MDICWLFRSFTKIVIEKLHFQTKQDFIIVQIGPALKLEFGPKGRFNLYDKSCVPGPTHQAAKAHWASHHPSFPPGATSLSHLHLLRCSRPSLTTPLHLHPVRFLPRGKPLSQREELANGGLFTAAHGEAATRLCSFWRRVCCRFRRLRVCCSCMRLALPMRSFASQCVCCLPPSVTMCPGPTWVSGQTLPSMPLWR